MSVGARSGDSDDVPRWPGFALATLTALTGIYAYWIVAMGRFGPLVTMGRSDADIMAADAPLMIPLHLVIAAALALGVRSWWRLLASTGGLCGVVLLAGWAALVTSGTFAAALLLVSYVAILGVAVGPASAALAEALAPED